MALDWTRWRELSGRLRNRLHEGALAARLLSRSGMGRAARPLGAVRFSTRALRYRLGPHLASLFHACNTPDKTALICGSQRLSYAELEREVERLARALGDLGVTPGDRVALMLPNGPEHLVAQVAIPRLGATVVEIGYRLKEREVGYILTDAGPAVLIYHGDYRDVVAPAAEGASMNSGQLLVVAAEVAPKGGSKHGARPAQAPRTGVGDLEKGASSRGVGPARSEDAPGHRYRETLEATRDLPPRGKRSDGAGGVLIYTSGTTGAPKGADRSFEGLSMLPAIDLMVQVGMRHDDRHLVVCPLYHSAAPAFCGMMLILGATVAIAERFDELEVLERIEREKLTSAFMVPTMLARLAAVPEPVRQRYDTSSLRWVCSGAAPLPTATARAFQAAFGDILWNFYGATETGLVTLARPEDHEVRPGTVGRALAGNEIVIVDDDGDSVPAGEVGEIYARNGMLFSGYHENPGATRSGTFESHDRDGARRGPGQGFFSVGDLGRLDADGYLYLESRVHDMVISGGVNIYPREIEDHLLEHPDIADTAVVGVPDERWGESLVAFVVRRPGHQLNEDEVIEHCRRQLADYKRPRRVEFVDEIPRNPTGKILKRALRPS